LLARLYARRGVRVAAQAHLGLDALLHPSGLADIDRAAERIAHAVRGGESILVVGDFDADGATSVALVVSLLRAFGASDARFLVPNRFEFGYGLSPEIVQVALRGDPRLIITVDNGTSSVEGVALANAHHVDVIVTDHHLPGTELPAALAMVNPNGPACGFASKALAGVGVAWYVMSAVRARLREEGWFVDRTEPNVAEWLDLVALGTVADVVPLDHNNRALVHQGVRRMRAGRCRPGIRALVEAGGRRLEELTAEDLGFVVGPRLNAAGRLDDMSLGIRCLLAEDLSDARRRASALDELNRARRELESSMVDDARLIVAAHDAPVGERFGVTVYDPGWHQGVIGIVAGRLRERFHRPVVAFADAGDIAPDELKGSARSLPGLHVRDVLDTIATRHPGLIGRFGGHAMAAGLSVKRVHYERFGRAFNGVVRERLPVGALEPRIETDGELDDRDLSLDNALLLRDAGPWGQAFPAPTFHGVFALVAERVVGERHLKLTLMREGRLFDAIAFGLAPIEARYIDVLVVYRLGVNTWSGTPTLQLMIEHVRPVSPEDGFH
jgi:single-stranded-DNA-specific exonuclease